MSFQELGAIRSVKTETRSATTVWQLTDPAGLPDACGAELFKPVDVQALPAGGTSWLVSNPGQACSVTAGALQLQPAKGGKPVGKLTVGLTPDRSKAMVVPAGAAVRMSVFTAGPCLPTKAQLAKQTTVRLQLTGKAKTALGTVTAKTPACAQQSVQLTASPVTETTRTAAAPTGLTAHLMTATLQQHAGRITGTLFVTNTTSRAFTTTACPSVTTTLATATLQAQNHTPLTCDSRGLTIPAHGSTAIELTMPVKIPQKDYLLADIGAYLTLGLGDDASRARTDA